MARSNADLFQLVRVDPVTGAVERVPARDRIDAILARPDAATIVRSMDPQTLFGLVHEAGLGDAAELVELATPAQLQAFVDFDCWTRDAFDLQRLTEWLPAILDRDDEDFEAWYAESDIEVLALLLRGTCAVYLMEEDRDYLDTLEDAVVSSPCGTYAIVFPDDSAPVDLVRMLLDRVYGMNLIEGHRLLESVRWEITSDLEEHALQLRTARMGDLGWVPFHEAMEVFAWRDPSEFAETARRRAITPESRPVDVRTEIPPVDHHLQALDVARSTLGETLLHRALASLPNAWEASAVDTIATSFTAQFRALVNRAHTAERGTPGDVEGTTRTIDRVIRRLSIGLELASRGDEVIAARVLATTPLRAIHQAGHSASVKLAQSARAIVKRGQLGLADELPLSLLSDAERDLVEGLLEPRPVARRSTGDLFASLAEVEAAASMLGRIAFVELLYFGLLRHVRGELAGRLADTSRCRTPIEGITFRTLTATLVLRRELELPLELEGLRMVEIDRAIEGLQRQGDATDRIREHLLGLLTRNARIDVAGMPVARLWADAMAISLGDELGDVRTPLPEAVALSLVLVAPDAD